MARYTGPMTKKSRRLGVDLVGGDAAFERRPYPPGQHGRGRIKESEYRSSCGRSRRPASPTASWRSSSTTTTTRPARRPGKTGDNLLQLLECRLDNVVYRAGFARTRRHARQLVVHGHFMVNGKKVDIPSFQVTAHDVIDVREKSLEMTPFIVARETHGERDRPGLARGAPDPDADPRAPAPGPGADRHPGPGAAHRRVLLEEVTAGSLPRRRGRAAPPCLPSLSTEVRVRQIAGGPGKERTSAYRTAPDPVGRVRRRVPLAVRHRAAGARLRLHARQLAASYPAVLDPGCLGHQHQDRHASSTSSRPSRASRKTSPRSSSTSRASSSPRSTTSRSPCTCASRVPVTSPPPTSRRRPVSRCTTPT